MCIGSDSTPIYCQSEQGLSLNLDFSMIMEYFGFSVIFSFVNNFFLYWIEYIKEKKVYNEPLPVQHWTNTKECFLGNIYDYEWGSHYLSFEQYGKLNYPCITCKGFSYC